MKAIFHFFLFCCKDLSYFYFSLFTVNKVQMICVCVLEINVEIIQDESLFMIIYPRFYYFRKRFYYKEMVCDIK